ncbi:unnamed protein product [Pleuronectes platessa]|uniref:Uncharacterized protein n=1 Tax=Pleuronectes platessa TaxID=8262 RepID=A0A9N7Z0I6_PLEPL|nr:unnamed protein product [Pleuronectes platessa]
MDESWRREAQAVVETSYDEKVSGTCKSEQLEECRHRREYNNDKVGMWRWTVAGVNYMNDTLVDLLPTPPGQLGGGAGQKGLVKAASSSGSSKGYGLLTDTCSELTEHFLLRNIATPLALVCKGAMTDGDPGSRRVNPSTHSPLPRIPLLIYEGAG